MRCSGLLRSVSTLLLLGGACATTRPARVDPSVTPMLPSPRGDLYTRAPGMPNDPLVASVAGGLPWDETLSGVATAVALAHVAKEPVDACRVRWMAVLAGYPYPVRGWRTADAALGEVPEPLLAEARAQAARRVDVGLVRARDGEVDRWVLVVGERTADLPPIPREVPVGDTVTLGAGSWVVSDALGELRAAEGTFVADTPGEWLVAARAGATTLAAFPIYVGETSPKAPPLGCLAGTGDAASRADTALVGLRATYAFPAVARDPALDSVARARLRAYAAGETLPNARDQLRAAGVIGVPVAAGACRAATVEACLAAMWWSPEDRGALVGDVAEYGLALEESRGEVRMVVVGAG